MAPDRAPLNKRLLMAPHPVHRAMYQAPPHRHTGAESRRQRLGASTIRTSHHLAAARRHDRVDTGLAEAFGQIVGAQQVITAFDARLAYARDRLPFAVFRER